MKETRLCRKPLRERVRERLAQQPKILEECRHMRRAERAFSLLDRKPMMPEDDASLKAGLVTFMIEQFFRGAEAHKREKPLASWLAVFPDFLRHVSRNQVRAVRTLRG